jgi:hypothetical protein
LRAKRIEKKFGLRKFAELVGVSPTYLTRPTLSRFAMGSEIGCVKNFCGENRQSSAIDFIYSVFGL